MTDFRLFSVCVCLFVTLMLMISYYGTVLVLLGFFKCFFYFYSLYIVNVVSKCVYHFDRKKIYNYPILTI